MALWSSDIMLWITEVTVVKACHNVYAESTSRIPLPGMTLVLIAIVGVYSILLTFN